MLIEMTTVLLHISTCEEKVFHLVAEAQNLLGTLCMWHVLEVSLRAAGGDSLQSYAYFRTHFWD